MKKTFCDACGQEITQENKIPTPIIISKTAINIEPSSSNGTKEDICLYCLIKKLDTLDNRPRCAE